MGSVLGKRLENLREEKDWSKTTVAKKIGVGLTTYANWEYGDREPDYKTLIKIAELYNVSLDYLLGVTDVKNPSETDREFMKDISDPDLKQFIVNEIPMSTEEELKQLRAMWDIIKRNQKK